LSMDGEDDPGQNAEKTAQRSWNRCFAIQNRRYTLASEGLASWGVRQLTWRRTVSSKHVLAALLLASAAQVFPQTVPAATKSPSRVSVGAGVCGYNDAYHSPGTSPYPSGIMEGATIWLDIYPNRGPAFLQGLGVEAEARSIDFGRPSAQPSNLREDTGGGGAIYTWRHFRSFTPYGRFLWELGSVDFKGVPGYNHDNRDLRAFGGGINYRMSRNVWVRADYTEQSWQRLFVNYKVTPVTWFVLKPRGVTIGVSYNVHFRHRP
jgi:Outer membrane protein beta-barrel domain